MRHERVPDKKGTEEGGMIWVLEGIYETVQLEESIKLGKNIIPL